MAYKPKFQSKLTQRNLSHQDEEIVLIRKLVKSLLGIVIVLTITIGTLQLFGPKIFSLFGYLSLDRFKKTEETKMQTQNPIFADLPKATKNKEIDLEGYSEADSTVKIFVNGPEASSVKSDFEGKFKFEKVQLLDGQNIIFAKAEAQNKTESEKSETVFITVDTKKPSIDITSPKNGEEIKSIDSRVPVKGKVNEKSQVTINSHVTIVDSDGNFQSLVKMESGENKIVVTAIDEAGNEATSSIQIKFKKR